jgi:hypothetical protein
MAFDVTSVPLSLTIMRGKPLVSKMCDRARAPRWGGERGIDHQAEALPDEVIDHSEDAEAPAAHQRVHDEVE